MEDFAAMKKAAETLWPRAILSNSGIALGLARMAAEDALGKHGKVRRQVL